MSEYNPEDSKIPQYEKNAIELSKMISEREKEDYYLDQYDNQELSEEPSINIETTIVVVMSLAILVFFFAIGALFELALVLIAIVIIGIGLSTVNPGFFSNMEKERKIRRMKYLQNKDK